MSNQNTIESQREALRLAYCATLENLKAIVKPLIGLRVGSVNVTTPQNYEDRGYECAAWWEKRTSATGVFDVVISEDYHNKNRLFFSAKLPATITEDYFPSLFCGNLIGKPYNSKANAGKPCREIIIVRNDIDKTIAHSSASYETDGMKWAILPEHWNTVLEFLKAKLVSRIAYMKLATFDFENFADDQYLSKLGQVGYAGQGIRECTEAIQEIHRCIESRKQNGSRDYFAINNPFAIAA